MREANERKEKSHQPHVAIASDHAGYTYKQKLLPLLKELGFPYSDLGAFSEDPSDYPDYAIQVAEGVAEGRYQLGILICGTGVGMAVTADKVPGIRAALCNDPYTARMSREHNDANILVLASRVIGVELAKEITRVWLTSSFSGEERHCRRLQKILQLEKKYFKR